MKKGFINSHLTELNYDWNGIVWIRFEYKLDLNLS